MEICSLTLVKVTKIQCFIFIIVFSYASAQECTQGEIRLARNSTPFEGGIDVCVNNSVWGTVCNDFWGPNEVQVACRQLGFAVTGTETFIDLLIDGGPDIVIDNINCTGSEPSLVNCSFSFEVSDCLGDITHKVGVRCHEERPPQNVSVITPLVESSLNVTWAQPLSGITNQPVVAYNIECATTRSSNGVIIQYKTSGTVPNTSNSISFPIDNYSPSVSLPVYNCCVEAQYETYSSLACAMARLEDSTMTTSNEVSFTDNSIATVGNTSAVGGALGAIIALLTLLFALALLGILYLYIRIRKSERAAKRRDRTYSSSSDAAEHVVDNPTYGANESTHDDTYHGAVNGTVQDYEPVHPGGNSGAHHTVQAETIIPNGEGIPFDHTLLDSVQI